MLDNIMQGIGGGFYLLNKIFLWLSERQENVKSRRKWRIISWSVYLIGLPAWLIIFYLNRNWIAGCLEASGGPSMILGLLISIKGEGKAPKWLDYLAITLIIFGISYSLYDFAGITTINQIYEIGVAVGFLIGNYSLAKEKASGYLWFILMHVFAGLLMYQQEYIFLMILQLISLGFIIDAYWRRKKIGGEENEKE